MAESNSTGDTVTMDAETHDKNAPITIDVPQFLFDMNDIRVLARAAQIMVSEGDEEDSGDAAMLMRMVAERAQVLKSQIDLASMKAGRKGGAA